MVLFQFAACRGGRELRSDPKPPLHELILYCALHLDRLFTKADIRVLQNAVEYPDPRTPAEINESEFSNTTSALSALLNGDSLVPERHSANNNPDALWHHLPAANVMRLRRERGYPMHARALPVGGYPLEGASRPWDDDTKTSTDDLVQEMLRQFEPVNPEDVQDIDDLGNKVWKDPNRPTRNFWGFSEEGLARWKAIKRAEKITVSGHGGGGGFPSAQDRLRDGRNYEIERARELATRGGRGGGGGGGRGFRGAGRGGRGYY
jgi:hypothetical protein